MKLNSRGSIASLPLISSKTNKQNPARNARTVYMPPNPATAATRIREKLGDEYADKLKEALEGGT